MPKPLPLRFVELATQDFTALTTVGESFGERRRDDHAVELLDHLFANIAATKPPRRYVRYFQLSTQHRRRESGQKSQHRARFNQPGTERIDNHDLIVAHGLQQAGDAEA